MILVRVVFVGGVIGRSTLPYSLVRLAGSNSDMPRKFSTFPMRPRSAYWITSPPPNCFSMAQVSGASMVNVVP